MSQQTAADELSRGAALYFARMFSENIQIDELDSEDQVELLSVRSTLAALAGEIPDEITDGGEIQKALILIFEKGPDEVKNIMLNAMREQLATNAANGGEA